MSAAIGAIGLTLLVGITGQLSLAHAFFVAIGAYGYCYFAGESGGSAAASARPTGSGCRRCWPRSLAVAAGRPRRRRVQPDRRRA